MKMKTVNRSEKIREYLKSVKPSDRSPKAVSDALKEKGIKVSPNLVSLVKMKLSVKSGIVKKKKPAKKANRKAVKPKASPKAESPHAQLVLAKTFLNSAGGIEQAKKILDLIDDLMS